MFRMKIALASVAALALAGCAHEEQAARGPAYVVVEENAEIADRGQIRRISMLDSDTLLIDTGTRYYEAKLFPACGTFADFFSNVAMDEFGIGLDRTSAFIIDGQRCPIRSLNRVERAQPIAAAAQPAGS